MKRALKFVLWGFVILIAIGVIAAIVNPSTPSTNVTADQKKETPKPKSDPGEITLDEFNKIENGLTLEQVEQIIGGKGELQSSAGDGQFKSDIYMWKGNTIGGNANVTFQDGKVMAKAQFGLE
jgi:hypothetical protein